MSNLLQNRHPKSQTVEAVVRQAIASGQLSAEAERFIHRRTHQGRFTSQEQRCLEILQDAIAQGCVRSAASTQAIN